MQTGLQIAAHVLQEPLQLPKVAPVNPWPHALWSIVLWVTASCFLDSSIALANWKPFLHFVFSLKYSRAKSFYSIDLTLQKAMSLSFALLEQALPVVMPVLLESMQLKVKMQQLYLKNKICTFSLHSWQKYTVREITCNGWRRCWKSLRLFWLLVFRGSFPRFVVWTYMRCNI